MSVNEPVQAKSGQERKYTERDLETFSAIVKKNALTDYEEELLIAAGREGVLSTITKNNFMLASLHDDAKSGDIETNILIGSLAYSNIKVIDMAYMVGKVNKYSVKRWFFTVDESDVGDFSVTREQTYSHVDVDDDEISSEIIQVEKDSDMKCWKPLERRFVHPKAEKRQIRLY